MRIDIDLLTEDNLSVIEDLADNLEHVDDLLDVVKGETILLTHEASSAKTERITEIQKQIRKMREEVAGVMYFKGY